MAMPFDIGFVRSKQRGSTPVMNEENRDVKIDAGVAATPGIKRPAAAGNPDPEQAPAVMGELGAGALTVLGAGACHALLRSAR